MNVDLITVPYDSGHRGARMGRGPEYFLAHGMVDALAAQEHDVRVALVEVDHPLPAEIATAFALQHVVADRVRAAAAADRFPLVLAGNCNTAIGVVAGLGASDVGAVWFDGHGDFNTPETTSSGFLDGMALAMLTGRCWGVMAATVPGFEPVPESCVVLAGARDFDPLERAQLEHSHVTLVPGERMRRVGVRAALGPAIERLRDTVPRVYLHVDLDVLDPDEARANGLAPPCGLSAAQLEEAIALLAESLQISAAALTAFDPAHDPEGRSVRAGTQAAVAILQGAARHYLHHLEP
jgi:arginase